MKKRLLSVILSLAVVLSLFSSVDFNAIADTSYYEYDIISVTEHTAKLTKYTGSEKNVEIPETIGSYTVVSLGDYLYNQKSGIETINIPATITSLGKSVFRMIDTLTSITVDSNNTCFTSEDGVLFDKSMQTLICCPAAYPYESYDIPYGVKTIGADAFSVKFHFNSTSVLKKVLIPNTVEVIEDCAFENTKLTEVKVPDSVKSLGLAAFRNTNAVNIYLGVGVETIGRLCFSDNSKLKNIFVDDENPAICDDNGILIGNYGKDLICIPRCTSIKEYTVPSTVTTVKTDVMCVSSIDYLNLNKATTIEEHAFNNSTVKTIVFPRYIADTNNCFIGGKFEYAEIHNPNCRVRLGSYSGCKAIKGYAGSTAEEYANNASITFIELPAEDEILEYDRGFTYEVIDEDKKTIAITKYIGDDSVLEIPGTIDGYTVTRLCTDAFDKCTALTECVIPAEVKYIEENVFDKCSSLSKVTVCPYGCYYDGKTFPDTTTLYACPDSSTQKYSERYQNPIVAAHIYEKVTDSSDNDEGLITYKCTVCGDTYTDDTNEIKHKYEEKIVAPTCTQPGYTEYYCSDCGDTYKDNYIVAKGHNVVTDNAVKESCVTDGLTEGSHCSRCGEVFVPQTRIIATGHSCDNGTVIAKASCTESGEIVYKCQNCNYSYSEAISPKGHSYVTKVNKADLSSSGSSTTYCSVCGTVKAKSSIAKIKSVTLSKASYTYTGKALSKPSVTVKDANGKTVSSSNYTVTYISRSTGKSFTTLKSIGQYKVKVTFKGNYTGTKYLYFYVKPKKMTLNTPSTGR
ncbi:MAG: leucine-rich repeat domain-containing protein, partial [Eubacterium sp.]